MAVQGSMFGGYRPVQNDNTLAMILQALSKLGQSGMSALQQGSQNALANKMANTSYGPNSMASPGGQVPRAALVDPGSNSDASLGGGMTPAASMTPQDRIKMFASANPDVPTGGSQPFTGGTQGLKMQMALDKLGGNQQPNTQQQQAMQSQQLNMQLANERLRNLQQYGTEQPGSHQGAQPKDVFSSESGIRDRAAINSGNETAHTVFNTDMQNLKQAGNWTPMDANGNPVKVGGGEDQPKVSYYQNDNLKVAGQGRYNWQVPATQFQDAMKVINPSWALHTTYKSQYGKQYQDSLSSDTDQNMGINQGQQQKTPPPIAGTQGKNGSGAGLPSPNAQATGNQYIQSVVGGGGATPQGPPAPNATNMGPTQEQQPRYWSNGKPVDANGNPLQ